MDGLTLFGLFAVSGMLVCYALESRGTGLCCRLPYRALWAPPMDFCKEPGRLAWLRRLGRPLRFGDGLWWCAILADRVKTLCAGQVRTGQPAIRASDDAPRPIRLLA